MTERLLSLSELKEVVRLTATINHSLQAFKGLEADRLKKKAQKTTLIAIKQLQNALKKGLAEEREDEGEHFSVSWHEGPGGCTETTKCPDFKPSNYCTVAAGCTRYINEDDDSEGQHPTQKGLPGGSDPVSSVPVPPVKAQDERTPPPPASTMPPTERERSRSRFDLDSAVEVTPGVVLKKLR